MKIDDLVNVGIFVNPGERMVQSQEDQVEEGEFLKFLLFCWKIKCESSFTVKIQILDKHISNDDGRRIRHRELSYSSNLSEVMIKL